MVPKPIKEPCKAALDAADKTFSNTKTTRPEVSLQYIAQIGRTTKNKALYPRLINTFPRRERKEVLTKRKIPIKDAANVGMVSN